MRRFSDALRLVLGHEGGFVNHPQDPGGLTNRGITRRVLSKYLGKRATKSQMKKLGFGTISDIYLQMYWTPAKCDELPTGIDVMMFDTAVNHGVARAAKLLQKAVQVKVDGIIGPKTLKAIAHRRDPRNLLDEFAVRRGWHYATRPHFLVFGLGWLRRLFGTVRYSAELMLKEKQSE